MEEAISGLDIPGIYILLFQYPPQQLTPRKLPHITPYVSNTPKEFRPPTLNPKPYLEVRCTYNLLSDCSYNPIIISLITTVTLDIFGL